jgi:hypothetical protein
MLLCIHTYNVKVVGTFYGWMLYPDGPWAAPADPTPYLPFGPPRSGAETEIDPKMDINVTPGQG